MLPILEIDALLPKSGKIIDLGCGQGLIADYLAGESNRVVIGVDLDKKRLPKSEKNNLRFESADIRQYDLKTATGVVISDVLHHINYEDQHKLLENVSKSLKRGSILIIKEINAKDFPRSTLSRFWDFVFYPKEKIYFSSSEDLIASLKKFGFDVKKKETKKWFPGSTNLYICTKK